MEIGFYIAFFGILLACFIELICIEKKIEDYLPKIVKYMTNMYFGKKDNFEEEILERDENGKPVAGRYPFGKDDAIQAEITQMVKVLSGLNTDMQNLKKKVTEHEEKLNEIYIEE